MKWKNVVEDYFTFNKPQRRTIILSIAIIIGCLSLRFVYSYFLEEKSIPVDTAFLKEADRLTQPDSSEKKYANNYRNRTYRDDDEGTYRDSYKKSSTENYKSKGELFPFDPNTLNADGWKRLGVRDKTVATIQNYLSKGGHFRQPEDIRRIYGLFPDEAERLLPYVNIASTRLSSEKAFPKADDATSSSINATPKPKLAPALIDINTADTTAFIALPGIGSKLAGRIVAFRNRLGGFYSVDQLGETYGIPDSVFQKIKPRLTVNSNSIKQLNVNTATVEELKSITYLKWNVANAIIQYRQQHGNYSSLDDLKKIALIDEQLLSKLSHYLTIQ